ncbi:YggS family pyridoxal phosphate-dependent enzyme [Candidatus Pelagibacter ubique]|jgi:pyridoxal phosphate enzyme (YggS family)|nr:YggS family pyridoxal phosphate-dependent enzyme [Candidatus Pelagibacter ubique]
MNHSLINLNKIQQEIYLKISETKNTIKIPKIIAVSKTFSIDKILPIINSGHIDFGENKVQEAVNKWETIKNNQNQISLHMIGKLQKNKVKYAVKLFDYIHSLDNIKLAEAIANEEIKQNKKMKIFIQINIGNENQKNGIIIDELNSFYDFCINNLKLNIIGFMCIPPSDKDSSYYFNEMKIITNTFKMKELSMGMSDDYLKALTYGSTFLRIGSKIFGERN